jgi:beta-N-acetylhexosaminidase
MQRSGVGQLSLEQKIGQTMMFGFHGTKPSPEIIRLIQEKQVGGVILFARNIGKPQEILELTTALQKVAYEAGHAYPLLISIDQENGVVRRLGQGTTILPGNMAVGATGQSSYAREIAVATGRELRALGVNFNLAPVLDVNNNPDNPVIGVRSFGEVPEWVAECGVQAITGYQTAGIAACGKHFPGHGDTQSDSHLTLPTIAHGRERLEQVELVPFRAAMAAGVDALMIAHVCFPEIEPDAQKPATMSQTVITGLLREELGFTGVITTDCMEMKAISDTIGTVEGVYQSFQAGVDLCFVSHSHDLQEQTIERMQEGLQNGDIPMKRLEDAVQRILDLKAKYLSWDALLPLFANEGVVPDAVVGCEEHQELARRVLREAVTLVKNDGAVIPLQVTPEQHVGVVYLENTIASLAEDDRYAVNPLAQAVSQVHPNTVLVEVANPPSEQDIVRTVQMMAQVEAIIIGTMNAHLSPQQLLLVNVLKELQRPLVVVSMRTPYELASFRYIRAHVATYEFSPTAAQVAAEGIFGKRELQGHLPVTIPGVVERGHRAKMEIVQG